MNKKHYVAIAKIIRARTLVPHSPQVEDITLDLAEFFAKDNPQFDRDRFLTACRVPS